jgi:ketosteroid isomerase-like protein
MLQKFSDAWNSHAIDALMSFMAIDCVFHAASGHDLMGITYRGFDSVRGGFEMAWKIFPDAKWLDPIHLVHGDRGFTESTFTGTRKDGTRVEARMVDIFTFFKGKILIKNAYRKERI